MFHHDCGPRESSLTFLRDSVLPKMSATVNKKQTNKQRPHQTHTHTKLTSKQQINNKIKQQNQIVKKHNKQTKTKN